MPTQPELPPIYWINLDRSATRRERMTTRLQSLDQRHTRIPAVDGKDEAAVRAAIRFSNVTAAIAACSASHLRAIKQAFLDGCEEALIIEDDMTFELFSASRWAELKRSLPARYGAVRLCTAETPRVLDTLYRRRELLVPIHKVMWCAGAYLIEREAMRCLLEQYSAGANFDVSNFPHEQDPEHLVFATLRDASAFCGPFDLRIPLLIYDGLDSDLHAQLLPQYQRARDFMLKHHDSLVRGAYVSPCGMGQRATRIAQSAASWLWYLPRWAFDHLADRMGYFPNKQPATKYFSQHALAFACDANGGAPYVMWGIEGRPRLLDLSTYAQVRRGDLVWVRIEDLARFNREVLPHVSEPFVLVTAESDYRVPSDFAEPAATIAASGKVMHWYATNYDRTDHQHLITALPLGMNYRKKHDLHLIQRGEKRTLLRRERFSLAEQEARWEAIAASAEPLERRVRRVYGDFWLNNSSAERRYGESRADIHAQLRHNPCLVFPAHLVTNEELLAAYARHAFVLSPHGRGLDCYRTWEALFVGCIVIVKTSPIDPLYRDLPVVIVKSWDEISEVNLERWLVSFGSGFDRGPLKQTLSLEHWLAQARSVASK